MKAKRDTRSCHSPSNHPSSRCSPSCRESPRETTGCTSRSGTDFVRSCSGRRRGLHPEPRPEAARPLFSRADVASATASRRAVLDGEIVIATRDGLDFDALQLRLHPAASRVASSRRRSRIVRGVGPAGRGRQDLMAAAASERRAQLEALLAQPQAAAVSDAGDARRAWPRLVRSSSRARASTASSRSRSTRGYLPASAHDQVKHVRTADCVVAGFRWHKDGRRCGRFAAARPLRRRGYAASRRHDLRFTMTSAELAGARAAAPERASRPSLARLGRARGAASTRMPGGQSRWNAARIFPGSRCDRARMRGHVRPSAGRPLPPRDASSALAAGQAARGLSLRPARSHDPFRLKKAFAAAGR